MSRAPFFPEGTSSAINSFVLYVALPAIILLNLPNLILDGEALIPIAIHWGILAFHFFLLYFLNKFFKFNNIVFSTLLIVGTLGNTAFLGIPLCEEILGRESLPYAVIFDQLGSGIAFVLYASFLIPFLKGEKNKRALDVIKGIVTFPPLVALVLGLLLNGVEYNPIVKRFLESLSSTLVPLAIISVGFGLTLKLSKETLKQTIVGLSLKLLVMPLLLLLIIKIFNFKSTAIDVSFLQSSMPPMITGGVLAIVNGFDEKLTTSLVGYGLVISFATIALLEYLQKVF